MSYGVEGKFTVVLVYVGPLNFSLVFTIIAISFEVRFKKFLFS